MATSTFDELDQQLSEQGVDALFDKLAAELKRDKKFHELFDVLLMRSRQRLGLPAVLTTSLDDLPEPTRSQVEDAYLAACREVGTLLLDDGKLREAWMYLRPVGDKAAVARALELVEPNDENLQDLIEIGLHEGVAPALGYGLLLKNYGTCNAITTFDGTMMARPRADQQAAAEMLLRHLHDEIVGNVRADIARREGRDPEATLLADLVKSRPQLFEDNNYHIDTTHLASVVRFSRLLEDPALLALAYDLTEYGRRLGAQFQFQGDVPFADAYLSHGLFFAAQLGRQVDEALAYFQKQAREADVNEVGTAPAEVYIALLARLKRYPEAIDATIELVPPGSRTGGFAPNLLELSRQAGNFDRLLNACRQRGDLVGYAAGLVEQSWLR